jgi:hypothetical protein
LKIRLRLFTIYNMDAALMIFFLFLALFSLIMVFFFYHLIVQYVNYIPYFKSLQKHFGGAYNYGKAVFFHRLTFSSGPLSVTVSLHSKTLFSQPATQIIITSQNRRSPAACSITTEQPAGGHAVEIGKYQDKTGLFFACAEGSLRKENYITPEMIDVLMQALSVQSRDKKNPYNLKISIEQNSIVLQKKGLPVQISQCRLLTECAMEIARKFLSEPSAPSSPDRPAPLTVQPADMRPTFILLAGIIVIMTVMALSFFYKSNYLYSVNEEFSGTVYKKLCTPNSEKYIFLPRKLRVTDEDFLKIQEGDRIEKVKGESILRINRNAPAEQKKSNILDLMEN